MCTRQCAMCDMQLLAMQLRDWLGRSGPLQGGSTCTGRKLRYSDIASYFRIQMAKCLREQIFVGTNFCVLAFNREKLCLANFPAIRYFNTIYGKCGVYFVQPFWIRATAIIRGRSLIKGSVWSQK